jgi:hypothetical protein
MTAGYFVGRSVDWWTLSGKVAGSNRKHGISTSSNDLTFDSRASISFTLLNSPLEGFQMDRSTLLVKLYSQIPSGSIPIGRYCIA